MSDEGILIAVLAVFCRAGCCLMVMPGVSGARIPAPVRLFLAIGVSLSIAPLLLGTWVPVRPVGDSLRVWAVIVSECLTGFFLGLVARCIFSAVHMAGILIAQLSGFGHGFASDDGQGEPASEVGALLSAAVIVILLVLDFHHEVIAAIVESYAALPFGAWLDSGFSLDRLVTIAGDAVRLALRMSAPFLVAAVLINLSFGMLNRMAPQIPVFFISVAFLVAAMLWLLGILVPDMIRSAVTEIHGALIGR